MELVAAIDTLTSHLETTFVALSSALAYKGTPKLYTTCPPRSESAHMIYILGPSVGAAKAKVILVLDGFEVKPSSIREETLCVTTEDNSQIDAREPATTRESTEQEEDSHSETHHSNIVTSEEKGFHTEDSEENSEIDSATEPPASLSPSPSSSRAASPVPSNSEAPLSTVRRPRLSLPLPLSAVTQKSSPRGMPLPTQTHAEEQNVLRAADRLLSRTLADACAEEDGGLSSELR